MGSDLRNNTLPHIYYKFFILCVCVCVERLHMTLVWTCHLQPFVSAY